MFVSLALTMACAPKPAREAPAPARPLRVAVLGDRTDEPRDAHWRAILAQVEARRPDLVVTVGDLADDAFNPAEWARALDATKVVTAPIEYTPGNHDIVDAASAAIFREHTGQAPYRSFDRAGVHFVIVDNSIAESWEELPPEQRAWLEADLAAHAGAPILVFMHKPFWATRVAVGKPDPMHDLFVRSGVGAVFTGHWHRHLHARFDGIEYTGVGSSGGATAGLPDPRRGNVPEFVEVTVDGRTLALTAVVDATERPVDYVTLRDQGVLRRLSLGDVNARLAADGATIELTLRNPGDQPLVGDARIDGGAWSVPASTVPYRVEPGGTFTTRVPVTPGTQPLPLPRVRLDYPLPDAGIVPYEAVVDHARELVAPRGPPPTLDGAIGAEEWAGAARIDRFVTSAGVSAAGDPTTVYVRYADDALYVAARCDDADPSALTRVHSGRDGGVVFDDRLGVLLAPAPDQLFWFYANPNGAVWDLHADRAKGVVDRDWNGVEARATVDATGWSLEARVPFAAMGLAVPPSTWAFDVRRWNNREQGEAMFTPAFGSTATSRIGVMRLVE